MFLNAVEEPPRVGQAGSGGHGRQTPAVGGYDGRSVRLPHPHTNRAEPEEDTVRMLPSSRNLSQSLPHAPRAPPGSTRILVARGGI